MQLLFYVGRLSVMKTTNGPKYENQNILKARNFLMPRRKVTLLGYQRATNERGGWARLSDESMRHVLPSNFFDLDKVLLFHLMSGS